jgi:hypothetical protein
LGISGKGKDGDTTKGAEKGKAVESEDGLPVVISDTIEGTSSVRYEGSAPFTGVVGERKDWPTGRSDQQNDVAREPDDVSHESAHAPSSHLRNGPSSTKLMHPSRATKCLSAPVTGRRLHSFLSHS